MFEEYHVVALTGDYLHRWHIPVLDCIKGINELCVYPGGNDVMPSRLLQDCSCPPPAR